MEQISKIIKGWTSYVTNNKEALKLAKKRLKTCVTCKDSAGKNNLVNGTYEVFMPDNTLKEAQGKKCKQCGCPASTFSRSKNYKCPLNKWK